MRQSKCASNVHPPRFSKIPVLRTTTQALTLLGKHREYEALYREQGCGLTCTKSLKVAQHQMSPYLRPSKARGSPWALEWSSRGVPSFARTPWISNAGRRESSWLISVKAFVTVAQYRGHGTKIRAWVSPRNGGHIDNKYIPTDKRTILRS